MSQLKRVLKELEECKQDVQSGIILELIDEDDLTNLMGFFTGPPETPYHGGSFQVEIKIPGDYPFKPPQIKFLTRVYHPNISSVTGAICLDILKEAWTPILTLKSSLLSLQSLLQSPEPNDPQDAEVARHYLSNEEGFKEKARSWTKKYAWDIDKKLLLKQGNDASHGIDNLVIEQFENMGFPKETTIKVLTRMGVKSLNDVANKDNLENKILEDLLKEF